MKKIINQVPTRTQTHACINVRWRWADKKLMDMPEIEMDRVLDILVFRFFFVRSDAMGVFVCVCVCVDTSYTIVRCVLLLFTHGLIFFYLTLASVVSFCQTNQV